MDRNDRNILILGVLILVALAIAYYFLLFSPLRQDYLAKYDERTRRESQKQQLEQTAAQLENIRRNADDIERQILELSKRIPEQAEIPTLVVQTEEVARAADVTQLRIEPGDPQAPPGGDDFSRIPITMSFEGTYEQLQDFLLRVRNLARLVTINAVNYEPAEERAGGETTVSRNVEDLLMVELEAEVYVQPAAGGIPAAGASPPPPPPAPAGKVKAGGAAKVGTKGGGTIK
ncbi:MAG: type 4a pilus biogenesis protein PilO [Actinomycetota bacterium]|nr:type 4a pilus biogenesis protein PilO [Actinomycetota bacterium]